jgi:Zn-dependent metalloprotease
VPNRAFCLAAHALSGDDAAATTQGVRRAARAWIEANAGYWTSTADFEQGCRGVIDAAAALGYEAWELEALADAWAEVGVFCADP